jgi:hypothetical protein
VSERRDVMSLTKKLLVTALVLAALPLVACHKAKRYDATVEVLRVAAIRRDEAGNPLTTDVEFSYTECPGSQMEVIRGGKEFSECVRNLKVGDKVKVKLEHKWDPEGYYDFDVYELNGCERPPDLNDEASFKMVRDCSDWNVNGARVGFQCDYAHKKALNKKCPWFKTR